MCKHQDLEYQKTVALITTAHKTNWGFANNIKTGSTISVEVQCMGCLKKWKVNKRTPLFVKDFIETIETQLKASNLKL